MRFSSPLLSSSWGSAHYCVRTEQQELGLSLHPQPNPPTINTISSSYRQSSSVQCSSIQSMNYDPCYYRFANSSCNSPRTIDLICNKLSANNFESVSISPAETQLLLTRQSTQSNSPSKSSSTHYVVQIARSIVILCSYRLDWIWCCTPKKMSIKPMQ